ncbi:MAG: helix-turn-helix domain-containing protein [Armatimonadota bacterium]|nr:helix-turn-helix domain-containing protein [Armatimonadota bacterium]MDR5697003.1 helix-turn-helix domain-containing protein [Armatimonadota bacterium]
MNAVALDDLPEVLTVEQAAGYLQLHKVTVYKYIREGLLPAARIGKVYRILRPDLERFLRLATEEQQTGE